MESSFSQQQPQQRVLEIVCTSVEDVKEAVKNGADRIELCQNLQVGGLTPSNELI